jgi:TonB family protein
MVAKEEPTPSVKQRIAELHRKLMEAHLEEMEAQEKEGSENPESGPVVSPHVMPGGGYGVGPGRGSAGIEQDKEFLLYYRDVQQKIKDSWSFAGGSNDLTAIVTFGINPDGTLSGIKVNQHSSDPAFDESVVRAIKRAAPFLPPPDKYRTQFSAGVETTFKLGELKS